MSYILCFAVSGDNTTSMLREFNNIYFLRVKLFTLFSVYLENKEINSSI